MEKLTRWQAVFPENRIIPDSLDASVTLRFTPEMIRCDGCRLCGAKTPFCNALCPIRRCALEKAVDTCADCSQMDVCATLGQITAGNQAAADRLKKIRAEKTR